MAASWHRGASDALDAAARRDDVATPRRHRGDSRASPAGPAALYAGARTRAIFAAALLAIEFAIFEALRDQFNVSRDDFAFALDALATAVAAAPASPTSALGGGG